jgi:hypothetical protein
MSLLSVYKNRYFILNLLVSILDNEYFGKQLTYKHSRGNKNTLVFRNIFSSFCLVLS